MSDRYPQFPPNAVSVTEVLDACGLIYHASQEALERGERVHQAVALMLRGRLDWRSVDPRILGYVESARSFNIEAFHGIESVEIPIYNKRLQYCGTPDLVTSICIIDFKSGPPAPWHRAQLGGYFNLLGEGRRLIDVYLQEDGSLPKLKEHQPSDAWRDFLTCLNFYRLKERYGTQKNGSQS